MNVQTDKPVGTLNLLVASISLSLIWPNDINGLRDKSNIISEERGGAKPFSQMIFFHAPLLNF